uniref:ARM repeat N-terminal plant domain-containing protein n=1 Tax=Kalanchoe fedtschenkoi TaxID=63787 RepID=A0A7N0SYP8_KALFE
MPKHPHCSKPHCFFCAMDDGNPATRRTRLARCFSDMPHRDDEELVLALSSIWSISMAHPDDPEFPSLGIFKSMAGLVRKAIGNRRWLLKGQNVYTPYYAAHIIGSYTMNKSLYAEKAVESGVVQPLMELMRGKISWVEQRVAVRALGHLASHRATFKAVAEHEVEIINLAKEIASTCIDTVYIKFIRVEREKRLRYQCDLLTKGTGGAEMEDRKAEEWASQIQCWALHIIHCFVSQQRSIKQVCNDSGFLRDLCLMWGGLANSTSPAGIGLIRTLCHTKPGRRKISTSDHVLIALYNVSRSSDDWQYMAIDCLILLLKDPATRNAVFETTVPVLADLVELEDLGKRSKLGEAITQTILIDYHKFKYGDLKLSSAKARLVLNEVWDLKVERRKKEKLMTSQEIEERRALVKKLKKQGNELFWAGEIEKAAVKYTEGLDECVTKMRRQRMILHSNRAQCNLMMKNADEAISDATRALCLGGGGGGMQCKSLWRRAQAYDMKGLAKESLLDCLMFVNGIEQGGGVKVPYYAARMINKQMNATWLFASAKARMNTHVKENI